MPDLDGHGGRAHADLYTVLLWVELHVDMLLTKGVAMERYTGPTLLTYEEWWKWDSARVKAGKGSSRRRIVSHCLLCKKNIVTYPHVCKAPDYADLGDPLFDACERVMVDTE